MKEYNVRSFARVAVGATAAAAAALSLAIPASAEVIDRHIEVPNCANPPQAQQICNQVPSVQVTTDGPIMVEFTASSAHCSTILAVVQVDNKNWGEKELRPGQADGGYFISASRGTHTIGVQAVGRQGGCNTGRLASWGGDLHIETNADALNGRG